MVFDSDEFSKYVHDSKEYNRCGIEQLFLRIADKKNHINHIRFLDDTGMETLKIVHFPNTSAVLSDPSSLFDRSDSDLFSFGKTHDANALFISPIALESRQSLDDAHAGPAMVLALPTIKRSSSVWSSSTLMHASCFPSWITIRVRSQRILLLA